MRSLEEIRKNVSENILCLCIGLKSERTACSWRALDKYLPSEVILGSRFLTSRGEHLLRLVTFAV